MSSKAYYQSANWVVYKNGAFLLMSHKTSLMAVIDKLERGDDIQYIIRKATDQFVKVETLDTVDPEGVLNITFLIDQQPELDEKLKDFLADRYGDFTFEGNNVKLDTSYYNLFRRAKKKLKDNEFEALVERCREEIRNGQE